MDDATQLAFDRVEAVLEALDEALKSPMEENRLNVDGSIQRFEFSIELFWKLLKKVLENQGVSVDYPKQALREAFSGHLIDDENVWITMLNDRNLTSHTYNTELADQIFARLKTYYPIMHKTFTALQTKFS